MVDVSEAFLDRLNESTAQAIKAIQDAKGFITKQDKKIKDQESKITNLRAVIIEYLAGAQDVVVSPAWPELKQLRENMKKALKETE